MTANAVHAAWYTFDRLGRLTAVVYDDSSSLLYSYDVAGNLLAVTSGVADTRPNAFSFVQKTGVPLGSFVASDPATISGIDTPAPISVSNGQYCISDTASCTCNVAGYTALPGNISPNQSVCIGRVSSPTPNTSTTTTLAIGSPGNLVSAQFLSTTTALGKPGVPLGVTAAIVAGQVAVNFLPPASDGGSPITGYTVISSPIGSTDLDAGSATFSHTMTGFMLGTPYTFMVAATNAIGTGNPSGPSAVLTFAGLPGAPSGASALSGNMQATISFAAPLLNGGSPISGYTATCSPEAGMPLSASGSGSPLTVTGLTTGITYTCTAHATNGIGSGPESIPSNSVTPSGGSPAALTVSLSGSGTGIVASTPAGIVCLGDCVESYPAGTGIELTSVGTGGSVFTGWLGACTGKGPCHVTIGSPVGVTATFAPGTVLPLRIDVDGNATYDALTDGLLILRYLFGLTGPSLTAGAISTGAPPIDPTQMVGHLNDIRPIFDVDGNGQADSLTDGLMILRYLFGLKGSALTAGAIGAGATRTGPEIETYIQSLMP